MYSHDNHLIHLKNIAVSPSAKENDKVSSKENRKDVKRELLKGYKSGLSSVISHSFNLLHQ